MSCEHCQHCRDDAAKRRAWREWIETVDRFTDAERVVLKAVYRAGGRRGGQRGRVELADLAAHTGYAAERLAATWGDLACRGFIVNMPDGRARIHYGRFRRLQTQPASAEGEAG